MNRNKRVYHPPLHHSQAPDVKAIKIRYTPKLKLPFLMNR